MNAITLLQSIHPLWIDRLLSALSETDQSRLDLKIELERFFERLIQAIDSGDNSRFDAVIIDWSNSLTETELEQDISSPNILINEIMVSTNRLILDHFKAEEAAYLLSILTPIYAYLFETTTQHVVHAKISYARQRLDQVQIKLEKLDRSKSDFISVAAHELKTPLTLIEGYASMMREKANKESEDPVIIEGIFRGTNRLKEIIDDMVDVSLLDNRLMALNMQPVWLDRLFKIILTDLSSVLQSRNLTLSVSNFPGFYELTFGDPERLLQAFQNIILNAIKYTPNGGQITIDGRSLNGFNEVTVKDTGIGIDPEDQDLIFEKFFSSGNAAQHSTGKTKFKGGGPGLGLHIAKGIIEAHGGAIWVESDGYDEIKNPGSIFHIMIPNNQELSDDKSLKKFSSLNKTRPNQFKSQS